MINKHVVKYKLIRKKLKKTTCSFTLPNPYQKVAVALTPFARAFANKKCFGCERVYVFHVNRKSFMAQS